MAPTGNHLSHFGGGVPDGKSVQDILYANCCKRMAPRLPMLKMRRKCKGMPMAEKMTAVPLPKLVLGTGAPKPEETYSV